MAITIDTPRLLLREHEERDAWYAHNLTDDPRARTFLSHQGSEEDSYRRFLANIGCWALFGFGTFAVIERATNRYVGNCGVFRMKRDFEYGNGTWGEPEAGWIIHPDCWGRGYASEAMAAAIDWFEGAFGPQATICMIVPGNAPSERIAARLGYQPIGKTLHRGDEVALYRRLPQNAWRTIAEHSFVTDYKDADLHVTHKLHAAPAGGGLALALVSNYPNGQYGLIHVDGGRARPREPIIVVTSAADLADLPHWAQPYRLAVEKALAEIDAA